MNTDEFLAEINRHAPPHLPRADREFLKRYEIVLRSGPYNQGDVPAAINLLSVQFEFLGKQKPTRSSQIPQPGPQVAISQVIVIHNSDAKQCSRIRLGLFQTGFINYGGSVFVNFSPFTHSSIESLPPNAFAETDYRMEYSVFEEAIGEGKTKPLGCALNPVFFAKDLEPTLVQLYFLVGGRKQPDFGPGEPLPSPLYQAFLNVDSSLPEALMDFMNTYQVYLFPMCWDPRRLSDYVSGIKNSMQLLLPASGEHLTRFWSAEQQKMRGFLTAAAQDKLGQMMFPPIFPICEDALVKWRLISGYFDPELVQAGAPKGARWALFEFKEADASDTVVRVRRYYGWDSYMLAELVEDVYRSKAAQVCQRCGRTISRGKHGRPKRSCSREDNPQCYKERAAEKVSRSKKRQGR